jgi:hypothetical protein
MKFLSVFAFAFVINNAEAIMPETITIPNRVVLSGKQKRNIKRNLRKSK